MYLNTAPAPDEVFADRIGWRLRRLAQYRQLMTYLVRHRSAALTRLGGRLRREAGVPAADTTALVPGAVALAPSEPYAARVTPRHAQILARQFTARTGQCPVNRRPERYPADTMTGARWPVN
ncbi:hypothetical protein [Krasilnikovia sp. MM14-A1259]|uniref:hypothetical protein n=1 Tax=Krasilnikovia sp. MM14-A1259 TaxID=3373539 RepID=UPI0037FC5244